MRNDSTDKWLDYVLAEMARIKHELRASTVSPHFRLAPIPEHRKLTSGLSHAHYRLAPIPENRAIKNNVVSIFRGVK